MPYQDPDEEDPLEFSGMEMAASEAHVVEMAECFAEEFARTGFPANQIWYMFLNKDFTGTHGALKQLGEIRIKKIIEAAVHIYGPIRSRSKGELMPEPVPLDTLVPMLASPCGVDPLQNQ